jgi:NDP-sugar pyrophosphorylase family protein
MWAILFRFDSQDEAMKAIILAGGLGERLRPFTQAIPQPLLPIGEQSLLEVQASALASHGFNEIFIATNYKSRYIENFMGDGSALGVQIRYSHEDKPLGTCGPVGLLRDELHEPFILMNGDILTTIDFSRFYQFGLDEGADFAIATKSIRTPFNFGSVQAEGNRVICVDEKPDLLTEIVAGIYFMRPELLEMIPDGVYYGIDNLITTMLSEGKPISRYLMEEYWLDIGGIDDYSIAEEAYQAHFAKK